MRLKFLNPGGEPVWSELHEAIPVVHGVIDVVLGSETEIDAGLLSGGDVYLGIVVNDTPELAPRPRLVAAAFALLAERAHDADLLGGKEAASYATDEELADAMYSDSDVDAVLATKGYCAAPCYGDDDVESFLGIAGYTPFSGKYGDLLDAPDLSEACPLPCYGDEQVGAYLAENGFLSGPGYGDPDVQAYLDENGYTSGAAYSDGQVQTFLKDNAYVPGPHFTGNWADIGGKPAVLADLGDSGTGQLTYKNKLVGSVVTGGGALFGVFRVAPDGKLIGRLISSYVDYDKFVQPSGDVKETLTRYETWLHVLSTGKAGLHIANRPPLLHQCHAKSCSSVAGFLGAETPTPYVAPENALCYEAAVGQNVYPTVNYADNTFKKTTDGVDSLWAVTAKNQVYKTAKITGDPDWIVLELEYLGDIQPGEVVTMAP